jgi:hypothetical protein
MITVANPLTISQLANRPINKDLANRDQAWPLFLRLLALAGAAAMNLSIGPVWIGDPGSPVFSGPPEPPTNRAFDSVENAVRHDRFPDVVSTARNHVAAWPSARQIPFVSELYSSASLRSRSGEFPLNA